jgi:hypothetical protein
MFDPDQTLLILKVVEMFESHVFVDAVNRGRQIASNIETYDKAVKRYLEIASAAESTGISIVELLEGKRPIRYGIL